MKRINSGLTRLDCLSLLATAIACLGLISYLYMEKTRNAMPVSYLKAGASDTHVSTAESRPFASINGTTYTFPWCQNSHAIAQKNRIYFEKEELAQQSGRTLSKLCQK